MARVGYVPARSDFVRIVLGLRVRTVRGTPRARSFTARLQRHNRVSVHRSRHLHGWAGRSRLAIPSGGKVVGVVPTDHTKSIDYIACHVSYISEAPSGLIERVLQRLGTILIA